MSSLLKIVAVFFTLSSFMVTATGCASVVSSLPMIIAAVQDGMIVVDTIARFADSYFAKHPGGAINPEKVHAAIERSRLALDAALRAAQGVDKLDQAQVDNAFAEFKLAYTDLIALVAPMGIAASGDRMMASQGGLTVPTPLAMTLKVKK